MPARHLPKVMWHPTRPSRAILSLVEKAVKFSLEGVVLL